LRIFLVGKISTGWRYSLVKGLAEFTKALDVEKDGWPVMAGAIFGLHDFVGPYETQIPKDTPEIVKTHRLCLRGIDAADLVYCWFDNPEAYASIFEMGYAKRADKYTVMAYPKGFDWKEFWFMRCCADVFLEVETPAIGLVNAMMSYAKSGRVKDPVAELNAVQKNLKRLEEIDGEATDGRGEASGGS